MDCQKNLPHCRHVYRFSIKWHNQGKNEKKKKEKCKAQPIQRRKNIITNADKGSIIVITDVEIISKQTENWLINTTLRHYKYTQLYNTISWLMTQSRELKKKLYFSKKWQKKHKNFTFHPKYRKEITLAWMGISWHRFKTLLTIFTCLLSGMWWIPYSIKCFYMCVTKIVLRSKSLSVTHINCTLTVF